MHTHDISAWTHNHRFEMGTEAASGRRTLVVAALTAAAMVAEITAGIMTNSMALLADGWHMSTHAGALGIAAFAYWYAGRHADDRRFTFGTGKVGALAAFASATLLAVVALLMVWESGVRLMTAQTISFDEALLVAILGLAVNVVSAFILYGRSHGPDPEAHEEAHHHGHDHGHDHNLRAAYLHVVADAFTSVLAIAALVGGKYMGWWWLDPAMGIAGAAVIAKWSVGLLRTTGGVLLDVNGNPALEGRVRALIENGTDNGVSDLHVWQVGPGHWAAIVSLVTASPHGPEHYRQRLAEIPELSHVTIEVHACAHT